MTEQVHRVRSTDLALGTRVEKAEHPWASKTVAKRLASDHLEKDPNAYSKGSKEDERTVVILNQNVKATTPRKKKKAQPQQVDTGPTWIPQNLRMWG